MARSFLAGATLAALALLGTSPPAAAAVITAWYGDDDGFGIGATTGTINATVSRASIGEAAGTDVRRIGNAAAAAFQPTGGFTYAMHAGATIGAASLTLRLGSFTPTNPVSGANLLMLDETNFSSFIASFTANVPSGDRVQTLTLSLPQSFYASLLDGTVSLAGSRLSEGRGRGSFQVDYLRLDVVTVSEPSALAMLGAGLLGLGLVARRQHGELVADKDRSR